MQTENVFLGLGSNLGNRTKHLCAGLAGLRDMGVPVRLVSSFYLTKPVLSAAVPQTGPEDRRSPVVDQVTGHPWYVNCVASIGGAPQAAELLEMCLAVESQQGRVRSAAEPTGPQGPEPRTLDLDILLVRDEIIDRPGLEVPHPRMNERRFVLQPLAEIAPEARHPVADLTIAELLGELPPGERIWLLGPPPDGVI